jgi:hypothetical protein
LELLLTLLGLYLLQCMALVPRGGVLFLRKRAGARLGEGPGWRLAHPLPSARSFMATRLSLVEDERGLCSRGATPWLGSSLAPTPGARLEPGAEQKVSTRGAVLYIDGLPFARAANKAHAHRLGDLLQALARAEPDARSRLVEELERCSDVRAIRSRMEELDRATRWLRPLSNASLLALFVVLPILGQWLHMEQALRVFLPAYFALHVANVAALAFAHRRLLPAAAAERFEQILGAALYPPLLLRSTHALRIDILGHAHPAAIAVVLLPTADALNFLRLELGRLRYGTAAHTNLSECEERLVAELAGELDVTPESLMAAPERGDQRALSYCPVCQAEYRLGSGECTDCRVPLQAFAS